MYASASTIGPKPARTIGWSSAMRTRIVGSLAADGSRMWARTRMPSPGSLSMLSVRQPRGALAHAEQAEAGGVDVDSDGGGQGVVEALAVERGSPGRRGELRGVEQRVRRVAGERIP